MQKRGRPKGFQFLWFYSQVFPDLNCIRLNPLQMIVRSVVLGFNGEGQSFNGSQVERGNLIGMLLFCFQSVEVGPIGTEYPVNDGKNQEGDLPAVQVVNKAYAAGDKRSEQVIRKRPEIALFRRAVIAMPAETDIVLIAK